MSRKYHKTRISKNGNNYYLQFHIQPWMRENPFFRELPSTKKNFKETLRTDNFNLAYERANKRLKELCIIREEPEEPQPKLVGADAYWQGLQDFETVSNEDLDELSDYYSSMLGDSVDTWTDFSKITITDEINFSHAKNNLKAIGRERERRNTKFFDKPHPYPVGLTIMSNRYIEELKAEGKPSKTLNKVKNASKRFLEYREKTDLELRLITPKIVSDYIKFSRNENRAISTFRNDINYLGAVFEFAKREGYLNNVANPFRGQKMTNFKEPITREPLTNEMIIKLIELASEDEELTQLIYVSYYTGMRLDEIFTTRLSRIENIRVFSVVEKGGNTASATRVIPLHSELKKMNLLPWKSPSSTALGKRFGRLKDKMLEELNKQDLKDRYVHHSFRHGFSKTLLTAKYSELEIADLTGHKKSNIGRTQAGRTYFSKPSMARLVQMIQSIPKL